MFFPFSVFAMHITEGIIVGVQALVYTLIGISMMGWGASRMKSFGEKYPEKKPLFGMGAAIIFFISLIPIPAFTGTTSHPCGTPLVAILLGPSITIALTGVSLLLQAAFFAHGGFGTWGANLVALGFFGSLFGWGALRLARMAGTSIFTAGCLGGLAGDLATYLASGTLLANALASAPSAQYSYGAYLGVIFAAYAPTQIPIALAEMLVTGFALRHAFAQRPEVLFELKVWKGYEIKPHA
jgi:cobalt/nickel transport system permease protein